MALLSKMYGIVSILFILFIIFSFEAKADTPQCDSVANCQKSLELKLNGSLSPDGHAISNHNFIKLFSSTGAGAGSCPNCGFRGAGLKFSGNYFHNTTASIFTTQPELNYTVVAWVNYSAAGDRSVIKGGIGGWEDVNGVWRLSLAGAGGWTTRTVGIGNNFGANEFGAWHFLCLVVYNNRTVFVYKNNSLTTVSKQDVYVTGSGPSNSAGKLFIGENSDAGQTWAGVIDDLGFSNRSFDQTECEFYMNNDMDVIAGDTTPPTITQNTYEVTSIGTFNSTAWRNDESYVVVSSDSTPTVSFTASEASNFTICTTNGNYTTQSSTAGCAQCSTNAAPPTETVHTCTQSTALSQGLNTLYISGIDSSRNENTTGTSTSGPLSFYYDNVPPNVTNTFPPASQIYLVGDIFNISTNLTDYPMLSKVYANISYPNGSTILFILLNNTVEPFKFNISYTTSLPTGSYNITFIANDTGNNRNSTQVIFFDVVNITYAPNVTNITPLKNENFVIGEVIEIGVNVSHNITLTRTSTAFANLSYPNGSIVLFELSNATTHQKRFNLSFKIPNSTGYYNITFIVNDSLNIRNTTEFTNWTVDYNITLNLSSGVTFLFDANNATQNQINLSGQNGSIGGFNVTNYENFTMNVSVYINLTNNPFQQFILDSEFYNWTVHYNQSVNATHNWSILCAGFTPVSQNATFGSLSGRFTYNFNNSHTRETYNGTTFVQNDTVFKCPAFNFIQKTFQFNLSGYTNISVDYFPDDSGNNLTLYVNGTLCGHANLSGFSQKNFTCNFNFNDLPLNITFNISNTTTLFKRNISSIYIDNLYVFNKTLVSNFITFKMDNASNYSASKTITTQTWTQLFRAPANRSIFLWAWLDVINPPLGLQFNYLFNFTKDVAS